MLLKVQVGLMQKLQILKRNVGEFVNNERGDMVGTIGWMAVTAVILVLVYTLIKNWLPDFVGGITDKMDSISQPMDNQ